MNNHYIYVWKEQGICGSGLPFYIGQGTHQYSHGKSKYHRAFATHLDNHQKDNFSYSQKKANKLSREGFPHVVEILYDNLTQNESDNLEKTLIKRLGRKINHTGILYNISEGGDKNPMHIPQIREKHAEIMKTKEHSDNIKKSFKKFSESGESYKKYIENKRNFMIKNFENPEYTEKYYAMYESEEHIEKLRIAQKSTSKEIEFKGVVYRSKNELARFLGISKQLITYRLKNNIQLDSEKLCEKQQVKIDGIIYESLTEASRKTGINVSVICDRHKRGLYNV